MQTPPPTWSDVAWVRSQWAGPFMVKGITRVDEGRRAVDAGATAISVSDHGGNNLGTTPATIRCLPAIVAAVGDEVEILLDGGLRRGSDVVKAVALGAPAVMIGRAYLRGLAANKQAGVENVLDIFRGGIDLTLIGFGKTSIHELTHDDIIVPVGFARVLGVRASVQGPTGPSATEAAGHVRISQLPKGWRVRAASVPRGIPEMGADVQRPRCSDPGAALRPSDVGVVKRRQIRSRGRV